MIESKLLLIVCSSDRIEQVRTVIDDHEVHDYTEIPEVRGSGVTGKHLGTRAFPGSASLVFTAVPADKSQELVSALNELAADCEPGEGMRVFSLDATAVI